MCEEIYTLRALLEPYAVRLSMEKRTFNEEYLDKMRRLVIQMGEFEQAGDYEQAIEADTQFHQVSCETCGHALVLETLRNLR